jgi:nitrogen PTS system EIIA component
MDLDDLFGPKPSVVDLNAEDRWEAIDELLGHLVSRHKILSEHRDAIAAAVKQRERAMSTGVGFGIGIPHTFSDLVSEPVAVIGLSQKGIQFDALDGQPVKRVVLFVVPTGQFQQHVHTLANIAKLLHRPDFGDDRWRCSA